MKRLHLHISVENLETSATFYTALFGVEPTKVKDDYMQWLVDEPAVNLSISLGNDTKKGLNHLGIQLDSDEEVQELEDRLIAAEISGEKEDEAVCCYAKSNKYWVKDPQDIIWENYHTMEQMEVFGESKSKQGEACCQPTFSTNNKWSTGGTC